jgi:deoxycytidine triphosphate deaminase
MILSDRDLKRRIIQERQEAERAKEWWQKGEWDKVKDKIIIDPFESHALGICTYDFSVGEEYRSLRDPRKTKQLNEGEGIHISPGETVLILTEEYVCLPKNVTGMVVPRARWLWEGTSVNATRVEPTWYGKLLIGFTNLAKNPVELYRQKSFCTCYFMETSETDTALTKDKAPFLGRTKIGAIEFSHALEQKLLFPDKVAQDDIEKVVDLYGWPWDVVRGMFVLNQKEITEYIEREVAPYVTEQAASAAEKRAFDELLKWHRALIIGALGLFGAFLGLLGYLIYVLSSSP